MLKGHFSSNGLSITAQDPLYYSTRSYSERITAQVSGYSHEIRRMGGYWSASLSINASKRKIEDWIAYGLGRHIETHSPGLVCVFEGFVNEMRAQLGPFEFSIGPLLDIKNMVEVGYSESDSSTTPPTIGGQKYTSTGNNLTSQARYGIIEYVASLNQANQTQAEAYRDTILADPTAVYPATSRRSNLSGNGSSVELSVLGYWHWLKTYYYIDPSSGDIDLSEKILRVLDAELNGLFSTDSSMITENTTQVQAGDADDRSAETVMGELAKRGGSRYSMGFYTGRRFYYQPLPTEIGYQQRLTGNRGIVNELDKPIRPWEMKPDKWLFYPDFLVGRTPPQPSSLGYDPRTGLSEVVTFTAPYEVDTDSVHQNTLDEVLARELEG